MYVGVDCGTQGTKVVILDTQNARILGEGYFSHPLISDANGRREQKPEWWIEAFIKSYRIALENSGINSRLIKGIGVSVQSNQTMLLT